MEDFLIAHNNAGSHTLIWNLTLIQGAAIANASITNAKIADLAVDSAKIQDLTVSTIKILGNAVSANAYYSEDALDYGGWCGGLTVSTDGGYVVVIAKVRARGGVGNWLKIWKGSVGSGTVLDTCNIDVYATGETGPLVCVAIDTSPAASQAYNMEAYDDVDQRRMVAINLKK